MFQWQPNRITTLVFGNNQNPAQTSSCQIDGACMFTCCRALANAITQQCLSSASQCIRWKSAEAQRQPRSPEPGRAARGPAPPQQPSPSNHAKCVPHMRRALLLGLLHRSQHSITAPAAHLAPWRRTSYMASTWREGERGREGLRQEAHRPGSVSTAAAAASVRPRGARRADRPRTAPPRGLWRTPPSYTQRAGCPAPPPPERAHLLLVVLEQLRALDLHGRSHQVVLHAACGRS